MDAARPYSYLRGATPIQATPTTRLIPPTMVGTAILATATVMAVLTTALMGAKVDALRAEFIGDITAGS